MAQTADALIDQALDYHAAGQQADAEATLRAALSADSNNADALNMLGLLLQEQGRYQDSIAVISQALAIDAEFPEALTNLARVQRAVGDYPAAKQSAERALQLDPELVEAALQLASVLLDLQRGADAEKVLRQNLQLHPECLEVELALGDALSLQGKHADALVAFDAVLRLAPNHLEATIKSGLALRHLNRLDDALIRHKRAVILRPDLADTHAALALTCRQKFDPLASAEACYNALEIAPKRADLWLLLAGNMAFLGRFEEAVTCQNRALAINPRLTEVWRDRAMLGQTADREQIAILHDILHNEEAQGFERIAAGFSLGRLLDTEHDFDAAFDAYATANRLQHHDLRQSGNGFNLAGFHQHVDWLIETFSPALFAQSANLGNTSDRPVFIVGMPRSGTTLVEQIVASHSQVFGAGERKDIHGIVCRLSSDNMQVSPLLWDAEAAHAQAGDHITRLQLLDANAVRIVDKMPDNIQFLGHIAVLFPNARIILCRRDIRDTCLSAFFQQFDDGISWTSDFADCAARAQEIERLVSHWKSVIPLPILEVEYERLVTDLDGQSRRLIAFLGLDWDPACLVFHETQRPVMTASYWQIRQPLYTASCGRWLQYRQHLAPLLLGLLGLIPAPAPEDWHRMLVGADEAVRAAIVHYQAGRAVIAEEICQQLLRLHADQPQVLNSLTASLAALERWNEAVEIQRQVIRSFPSNALLLYQLAWLLWRSQDPAAAVRACDAGLKLDPGQTELWLLRADCQTLLGNFSDAIDNYRHVLRLDPSSGGARAGLIQAGEVRQADDTPAALADIVSREEIPISQRVAAAFAIGRYHEAREDYDAAFAGFADANSLAQATRDSQGATNNLDVLRRFVDWTIETFKPDVFLKKYGFANTSDLPSYIVGMPRSGTTLVEQIAASHPLVFGEGERTDLDLLFGSVLGQGFLTAPATWEASTVRRQTDILLAALRHRSGNAARVLNKLPNNILWLGHISLLLPKARIIICRRDLRDVGLSCFCQNFADPAAAWADTLGGCAAHVKEMNRLLEHWRRVLPVPALEVQYESLVDDLEGQSRRLIAHLGLEWDAACLTFHETKRPVMTASNWQVRQPLYATSVGKWRHYQRHLEPLFRGLSGLISEGDD